MRKHKRAKKVQYEYRNERRGGGGGIQGITRQTVSRTGKNRKVYSLVSSVHNKNPHPMLVKP